MQKYAQIYKFQRQRNLASLPPLPSAQACCNELRYQGKPNSPTSNPAKRFGAWPRSPGHAAQRCGSSISSSRKRKQKGGRQAKLLQGPRACISHRREQSLLLHTSVIAQSSHLFTAEANLLPQELLHKSHSVVACEGLRPIPQGLSTAVKTPRFLLTFYEEAVLSRDRGRLTKSQSRQGNSNLQSPFSRGS